MSQKCTAGRDPWVTQLVGWFACQATEEYKTEFSMWAILASSLVVTTPILNCSSTDQIKGNFTPTKCRPSITDLQKEILFNKEVIAINQERTCRSDKALESPHPALEPRPP